MSNEEKKHALLSASSSHKWLTCTPSARLEEQFENKTSEYMAEGTLAHEIAEFKVRNCFLESLGKRSYTAKLKKFSKEEQYKAEMDECTDTYLDYIKSIMLATSTRPYISVEETVDYSKYVPEGFGTTDCLIISQNTLFVIDYKHGKGVQVSAEQNPQMKLYALGIIQKYKMLYPIETVKLAIVQPRLDNISEFEISRKDLENWGKNEVIEKAQKAFLGIGDFVPRRAL